MACRFLDARSSSFSSWMSLRVGAEEDAFQQAVSGSDRESDFADSTEDEEKRKNSETVWVSSRAPAEKDNVP